MDALNYDAINFDSIKRRFYDPKVSSRFGGPDIDALLPRRLMERLVLFTKAFDPRTFFQSVANHIKEHCYQIAAIGVGIVNLLNPLVLVGFGAAGPIAGSTAATVQASYGGTILAGSTFAILQSLGMTIGATLFFPVVGISFIAGSIIFSSSVRNWCMEKWDTWWLGGTKKQQQRFEIPIQW